MTCVVCGQEIEGVHIGAGRGDGQDFAHPLCFDLLWKWEATGIKPRSLPHRIEILFKDAHKIVERGPDARYEGDLKLDRALTAFGIPAILRMLATLIEREKEQ